MAAGCIRGLLDMKFSIRNPNPELTDIHLPNCMIQKCSWPLIGSTDRGSVRIRIASRMRIQLHPRTRIPQSAVHWGNMSMHSKLGAPLWECIPEGEVHLWELFQKERSLLGMAFQIRSSQLGIFRKESSRLGMHSQLRAPEKEYSKRRAPYWECIPN